MITKLVNIRVVYLLLKKKNYNSHAFQSISLFTKQKKELIVPLFTVE